MSSLSNRLKQFEMSGKVGQWSVREVAEWLRRVGFAQWAEIFSKNQVDGDVLLTITEKDLVQSPFNFTIFGQIRKLSRAIEKLKADDDAEVFNDVVEHSGFSATSSSVGFEAVHDTHPGDANATSSSDAHFHTAEESSITSNKSTNSEIGAGDVSLLYNNVGQLDTTLLHDDANATAEQSTKPCSSGQNSGTSVAQFLYNLSSTTIEAYGNAELREKPHLVNAKNTSTEPVLINGSFLDCVTTMEELYPEMCWRYQDPQIQLFTTTLKQADDVAAKKSDSSSTPDVSLAVGRNAGFKATVSHLVSPIDFHLQPNVLLNKINRLLDEMDLCYNDSMTPVPCDRLYKDMPCAVRFVEDGKWYRAKVVEVGCSDARIVFIDWGNSQFEPLNGLKPLSQKFGRFPPMALHCKLEGVRSRTLLQKKIDQFAAEIEEIGKTIFCKPSHVDECGRLNVSLWDLNITENLGSKYQPTEPICPRSIEFYENEIRKLDLANGQHLKKRPEVSKSDSPEKVRENLVGENEGRHESYASETQEHPEVDCQLMTEIYLAQQTNVDAELPEVDCQIITETHSTEQTNAGAEENIGKGEGVDDLLRDDQGTETPKDREQSSTAVISEQEDVLALAEDTLQDNEERLKDMELKAQKYELGYYASDMEAFLDGAPVFDWSDSSDEEVKPRTKRLKQVKREAKLKAQGKWPPADIVKKQASAAVDDVRTFKAADGKEYIKDFIKVIKPPKGDQIVYVRSVVSAREVFLHLESQHKFMANLQEEMRRQLENDSASSVLSLITNSASARPATQSTAATSAVVAPLRACAYKDPIDGLWYRARMGPFGDRDSSIPLCLIDVARTLRVTRDQSPIIKALPATTTCFGYEPQVFRCKIRFLCEPTPVPAECALLKELMPVDSRFKCRFERASEPWRVELFFLRGGGSAVVASDEPLIDAYQRLARERHIESVASRQRRQATSLVPYKSRFDIPVATSNPTLPPARFMTQPFAFAFGAPRFNVGASVSSLASLPPFESLLPPARGPNDGATVAAQPPTRYRNPLDVGQKFLRMEQKQPPHGYDNDIEAALHGDIGVAGYDESDDVEECDDDDDDSSDGKVKTSKADGKGNDFDDRASVAHLDEETALKVGSWIASHHNTAMKVNLASLPADQSQFPIGIPVASSNGSTSNRRAGVAPKAIRATATTASLPDSAKANLALIDPYSEAIVLQPQMRHPFRQPGHGDVDCLLGDQLKNQIVSKSHCASFGIRYPVSAPKLAD